MTAFEPICEKCEELIQPYLDRELSEAERIEAEGHLAGCGYCSERYRFEVEPEDVRAPGVLPGGDVARAEGEALHAAHAAQRLVVVSPNPPRASRRR